MTQEEANEKFTSAVDRVLESINSTLPTFNEYKMGEAEDVSVFNAGDAAILLEDLIENIQGCADDFNSIYDEGIDEDEEEDNELDLTNEDLQDDNPIDEDEN